MDRLILLLLALATTACGRPGGGPPAPPSDPGPVVVGPESAATVRRGVVESGPRLSGSLQPRDQAAVRAEVGGAVSEVTIDLGMPVKAGQVVARIDAKALHETVRSAETALATAESDLEVARRQEERVAKLVGAGALAERDREVAQTSRAAVQSRLQEARARLAAAREQVDSTVVRSPMDGVVSQRPVHSGDIVAPGALLFTVIDPTSMRLEGSVSSEDLVSLSPGTPVQFQVRGFPGQQFAGQIERVAPAADPTTRQIPVLVTVPNPEGRLIAGLFAEGRVAARRQEGLLVPVSAVETAGASTTVLRVTAGKTERAPVQLGLRDDRAGFVEVTQGLADGDVVLLGPARTLTPGTAVRLGAPNPPAPSSGASDPTRAAAPASAPESQASAAPSTEAAKN